MIQEPVTRVTLELDGFSGFVSVRKLLATRCREVPREPGVYVVTRPAVTPPRFRSQSGGGWFKAKDPTVPKAHLAARWVADSDVLYIGRSQPPLKGRVLDLVEYGTGRPVAHQGGRYLWQVQGSNDFLIGWKATPDPVRAEIALHEAFLRAYGVLPFANLRVG